MKDLKKLKEEASDITAHVDFYMEKAYKAGRESIKKEIEKHKKMYDAGGEYESFEAHEVICRLQQDINNKL